jgi:hypothetical protein
MDTAIDIDWLLSPFFFSKAPEKGRGKKHNSAPYIKLLVCFRK